MKSLIGQKVYHTNYGNGIIEDVIEVESKVFITVKFENKDELSRFDFPYAFDTKCLKLTEDSNSSLLNKSIENYNMFAESQERSEDISWLDSIGIKALYHFTDITNLKGILEAGYLYSRNTMGETKFVDGASSLAIDNTPSFVKSYARFFYKEKTPTLYASEGIKTKDKRGNGHRPIPVALIFSRNIMFHYGVVFLDGIGANLGKDALTNRADSLEKAKAFNWGTILKRGRYREDVMYNAGSGDWSVRRIKNRRNAEFLYPNKVDLKYLDRIAFRTEVDMQRAIIEIGEDSRYFVDRSLFDCDSPDININFVKNWYVNISENISIHFVFDNTNYNMYQLGVRIYFESGDFETIDVTPMCEPKGFDYLVALYLTKGKIEDIRRIEFYMDEFLSAVWEKNND